MANKTCEICGEVVEAPTTAGCGHRVSLCKDCLKRHPGAKERCAACEELE